MEVPPAPVEEGSFRYCFGCGEANTIGLKLKPVYDGEKVTATFTPRLLHQGWYNITHGGILYAILDEVTAYTTLCHGFNFGVTAKSAVRFKHVAPTDATIHASAWAVRVTSRLIETHGLLELEDGTTVAEVDSTFLTGGRAELAFIWDMDGVIVNSAAPHYEAWRETFASRGITYSEEQFKHFFGTRNDFTIRNIMGWIPDEDIQAIDTEKERRYRDAVQHGVEVLPGAMELLVIMKRASFPLALGTSAPRDNYEALAPLLHLDDYFDVVVTGEEVNDGKPSPDIYLKAAEKLGVKPSRCVVLEDSPLGVEAAKRAGMKCVAVTNTHPTTTLSEANKVISSLEETDLIDLIRWI